MSVSSTRRPAGGIFPSSAYSFGGRTYHRRGLPGGETGIIGVSEGTSSATMRIGRLSVIAVLGAAVAVPCARAAGPQPDPAPVQTTPTQQPKPAATVTTPSTAGTTPSRYQPPQSPPPSTVSSSSGHSTGGSSTATTTTTQRQVVPTRKAAAKPSGATSAPKRAKPVPKPAPKRRANPLSSRPVDRPVGALTPPVASFGQQPAGAGGSPRSSLATTALWSVSLVAVLLMLVAAIPAHVTYRISVPAGNAFGTARLPLVASALALLSGVAIAFLTGSV